MSAAPLFWSTPLKYCRWAARERPALFWSVIIGAAGPIAMPIVPPIRHYFGDIDAPPVPVTYPSAFIPSWWYHGLLLTEAKQSPLVPGNSLPATTTSNPTESTKEKEET